MGPRSLFEPLVSGVRNDVGFYVFDEHGLPIDHLGHDDRLDCWSDAEALVASHGRRALMRTLQQGHRVLLTMPESSDRGIDRLFDQLLDIDAARAQLEVDLESMSASSLALLEEAAMIGEVMTELSTGESEAEIVASGLRSLLVGASADRALFFHHDAATDRFEFVVQLAYDVPSRRAIERAYDGDPIMPRQGLLARAADGSAAGVLEAVSDLTDSAADEFVGPEHRAMREAFAVRVMHGQEHNARLLGVLVLLDKRATSYSSVTTFGSHETKLASALASMLASVLGARKSAELNKELMMATMIQQQILPDRPAVVAGFDLAGRCDTSGAVGGDYFDFLPMGDGRTLCVVADVSGHNLASGMVMVSARSALRLLSGKSDDIVSVFDELAAAMFSDLSRTERFITAAGVALRPQSDEVQIVNAGHNDTMVFRAADRSVERLCSQDTILGFVPSVHYSIASLTLRPGDVVVVYTDGITEAMDVSGQMFDESRLAELLVEVAARGDSAQQILDAIYGAVDEFVDDASHRGDDVTAIVIRYLG